MSLAATLVGADGATFLRAWLSDPLAMGAIAPSGAALAALITSRIGPDTGPVIELGPGTSASRVTGSAETKITASTLSIHSRQRSTGGRSASSRSKRCSSPAFACRASFAMRCFGCVRFTHVTTHKSATRCGRAVHARRQSFPAGRIAASPPSARDCCRGPRLQQRPRQAALG